jgi:hypothetical protein
MILIHSSITLLYLRNLISPYCDAISPINTIEELEELEELEKLYQKYNP